MAGSYLPAIFVLFMLPQIVCQGYAADDRWYCRHIRQIQIKVAAQDIKNPPPQENGYQINLCMEGDFCIFENSFYLLLLMVLLIVTATSG